MDRPLYQACVRVMQLRTVYEDSAQVLNCRTCVITCPCASAFRPLQGALIIRSPTKAAGSQHHSHSLFQVRQHHAFFWPSLTNIFDIFDHLSDVCAVQDISMLCMLASATVTKERGHRSWVCSDAPPCSAKPFLHLHYTFWEQCRPQIIQSCDQLPAHLFSARFAPKTWSPTRRTPRASQQNFATLQICPRRQYISQDKCHGS